MSKKNLIKVKPKTSTPSRILIKSSQNRGKLENDETRLLFNKKAQIVVLIIFLIITIFIIFNYQDVPPINHLSSKVELLDQDSIVSKQESSNFILPNLDIKGLKRELEVLKEDETIESLLIKKGNPKQLVQQLVSAAKKVNLSLLQKQHEFYTFISNETEAHLIYVYEISSDQFAIIRTGPTPSIEIENLEIQTLRKAVGGIIKTTLWRELQSQGVRLEIISQLEDALKWTIDFHHLEPNDKFRIIFEEKWSNKNYIELGKLLAVSFDTRGKTYYAFYVDEIDKKGFYDEKGFSTKKSFLISPIKYGRISSTFNLERLHPILKDKRPHRGTDYAAPEGDPIFAVAKGIISIVGKSKNNGNYVKIRHQHPYETQYLHMQSYAKGLKKGQKVKQGQIIGYIGQTGLATGPHVCFRFWKNGKQINHLNEDIGYSSRLSIKDEDLFIAKKDSFMLLLKDIPFTKLN